MFLEVVVAFPEVLPEGMPPVFARLLHTLCGQAEGEGVDAKESLAVSESCMAEGIDFLNLRVGHCKAADGDPVTVDHQMAPGTAVGPVVCIRIAEVEGEMKPAVGIHLSRRYVIESLGGL